MEEQSSDILLEVFEYLERDSLVNAMRTCKRWKSLITSSTTLMKKIDVFIRPSNIDQIIENELDIPHRNLMIHSHLVKCPNEQLLFEEKLVKVIESYHESAVFTEMVYFNSRFFFSYIQPLQNLTHLNLIGTTNQSLATVDNSTVTVSLPKLKTIGIKSATGLLRHFKDHKLETLKIIDSSNEKTNKNISEFLLTCEDLKEIKFMGFIPHLEDVESYKFKLTSLSVLLKGQAETNSTSVLNFIKSQKDSLKDLKLIGFTTKDFVEFGISHMNLRKFDVDLTRIRSDMSEMRVNKSIKKMMMQTIALSMNQMQKVIAVCQNIEELKIVSNSNLMFSNWLLKASQSMENLKHLHIDSLLGILLPQDLNFKNLETLTVSKLGGDAQLLGWVQLVSRCPSVKKVIVTGWGQQFMPAMSPSPETPVEPTYLRKNNLQFLLISLPEIEEIEIQGDFPLTDEVVDVLIMTNHSKLRKFTFASLVTEEVMRKVRRFYDTKIKCTIIKPSEGRKCLKRKFIENHR